MLDFNACVIVVRVVKEGKVENGSGHRDDGENQESTA